MADLPPEHIGNIPAGHSRDEEIKKREDSLAQQLEADAENGGGIPSDAWKPEREILQHFDPYSFELKITNPQPERHYVWLIANSTIISQYASRGYQPVKGNDKECIEHKGEHKAAGSTLRGVGDCLLYWCPKERREAEEAHYERKAIAMGAIEEAWEDEANFGPNSQTRRFGPLAHGRPNDPLLRRTVFRGTAGQIEQLNRNIRGEV
jgi:hypothetical protein